jgi:hypothetical protein
LPEVVFQLAVSPQAKDATYALHDVLLAQVNALASLGIKKEETREMTGQECVPELLDGLFVFDDAC